MARNPTGTDEKTFREPARDNCGWTYASFAMIANQGISREQRERLIGTKYAQNSSDTSDQTSTQPRNPLIAQRAAAVFSREVVDLCLLTIGPPHANFTEIRFPDLGL